MNTDDLGRVWELPELQEPITELSVVPYRCGFTEVEIVIGNTKQIVLWFDILGRPLPGRLALREDKAFFLVAQDSPAEHEIVRSLREHLNACYTLEEQAALIAFDRTKSRNELSQQERDAQRLLLCIENVEELRKLAIFGVVPRV